jgi:hypothetical protein
MNSDSIHHLSIVDLTTNQHVPDSAVTLNDELLRIQAKTEFWDLQMRFWSEA